jgi:molybdate transport system ATP-binding protein
MNSRLLSLCSASFRLGERLIFEKTTWTYLRGEQWAVLGANGSGKSLFADALRGRLPMVNGELNYFFKPEPGLSHEECIGHVSFERRKLELRDIVAQSRWNSLESEGAMRVDSFLSYERVMEVNPFEVTNIHLRARPHFDHRRAQAISLLDIEPFLERSLMTLSNGEMQRVQLARALCRPLRLLILDEPCAGLDVQARQRFLDVLGQLMRHGLQTLLIVSRPEDLPDETTHVLAIDNCQVLRAGPRAEMLKQTAAKSHSPAPTSTTPPRVAIDSPVARRVSKAPRELVRLDKVTVRYGNTTIFKDLDWRIVEGESWALLGPNGSGKTTALSLILGDHPQCYSNRVTVFGKRRGRGESMQSIKRRIGWFSPELLLHFDPDATCYEVVASGFRDSIGIFETPTPCQRAKALRLLRQYGLLDCADCPLCGLSAGAQRIVLLLRALVKTPKLLILDEPCQGLDDAHRNSFVKAVDAAIRSKTTTVIYVTHRPDELPPSIKQELRLPG